MGTNYYLEGYKPRQLASEPCEQRLHIGKSSYGWCFALHVIPEQGILDLSDWEVLFQSPDYSIHDEYGSLLQPYEMMEVIQNREMAPAGKSFQPQRSDEWLARNFAVEGPNGLARSKVSAESRCIGHGEGPWDLIEGEFS